MACFGKCSGSDQLQTAGNGKSSSSGTSLLDMRTVQRLMEISVGASLLAMRPDQSIHALPDKTPSRASSLPQVRWCSLKELVFHRVPHQLRQRGDVELLHQP